MRASRAACREAPQQRQQRLDIDIGPSAQRVNTRSTIRRLSRMALPESPTKPLAHGLDRLAKRRIGRC
jgi:hypothetical protein